MRKWLIAGGLFLSLMAALFSGCAATRTVETAGSLLSTQQTGIWVGGRGSVTVTPDVATVRLGVEAQQTTVAEAQRQAAEAMNRVMQALTGNGVAQRDIQTQVFNIQRVTRYDQDTQREVLIGYRVTNVVSAKIRNLDRVGTIIDAVAVAGGDLTRVDSITFSVDDPSAYYNQAREKAMQDAEARARQLASLSGVRLGKPTYVSESTQAPAPVKIEPGAPVPSPAPTTPISPGETEVIINVQVIYAIE